jgi:NAD+ diphosphatase
MVVGRIGSLPRGARWDPAADRRGDDEWLRLRWLDPGSRVVRFRSGSVGVDSAGAVLWTPPAAGDGQPGTTWALLGLDARGAARFAVEAPPDIEPDGVADWRSLREARLDDSADLLGAAALLNWHRTHPRCPRCGSGTVVSRGGWQRRCPTDSSEHFPRIDPAVIMLVHDGGDRALLGRQARWPDGWFSTLAGFVEPGESLEAAVAREVAEEVGLKVLASRYLASQPWPFPNSLMLGFHAQVDFSDPVPDGDEIAEAVWVTRDALARGCAVGSIRLPPALSISRWLIQQWFGAELPGGWSR